MLCAGRPSPLLVALTRSRHLAYCDEVVRYSRYDLKLPEDVEMWALRMFNMWCPTFQFNDDTGDIAHWMRLRYPELLEELHALSDKIELIFRYKRERTITNVDWDLIVNGVTQYRRYLLNNIDHCDCF